jgi:hypothetical protein
MTLSLREQLLAAGFKPSKDTKDTRGQRGAPQERRGPPRGSTGTVQSRPGAPQAGAASPPPRPPRPRTGPAAPPDPQLLAQRQQAERFAREQEQGRKFQEREQRRARAAALRALIARCALPPVPGEDWYNFIDEGRVRRIAVTPVLRAQIMQGELLIARCSDRYDLVPASAAEELRRQHPEALVALVAGGSGERAQSPSTDAGSADSAEDPYKDYVVPDDLTW